MNTTTKSNNNPNNFWPIMLTHPNVKDDKSSSSSSNDKNRFPLSGSIDQIGSDIQRIKAMGVDHIVFGYNFVPIGRDVTKVIDLSKELSKFSRWVFFGLCRSDIRNIGLAATFQFIEKEFTSDTLDK